MTIELARFDDMIATVVERAWVSATLRAVGWQQLVDLLARQGESGAVEDAYAALERYRPDVSTAQRARASASLSGRSVPERLFLHLVADDTAIVSPMLVGARVSDVVLIASLSRLSGPSRALLRLRPDRSPALQQALEVYGPADRALMSERTEDTPVGVTVVLPMPLDGPAPSRPVPIRTLVDRIERHRRRSPALRPRRSETADAPPAVRRFAFETDRTGCVVWTDAPERGAVIGLALLEAVDGCGLTAGATERVGRRLALTGTQLTMPSGGALKGAWRVDAAPVFSRRDGRFGGYVGLARRGSTGEGTADGARARPDDIRHLMHELKTPLNAIIGFSELIGEQLLGPVGPEFSRQLADLRRAGLSVLGAIEDVDLAVRLDTDQPMEGEGVADLTEAVADQLVTRPDVPLRPRLADPRWVTVAPRTVRHLTSRLIDALSAATSDGETLALTVTGRKRPRLRIATPAALADLPPHQLAALRIPPGETLDGPPLGLEFALRLVRRMAERAGGALTADAREFTLSLPPMLQQDLERQS